MVGAQRRNTRRHSVLLPDEDGGDGVGAAVGIRDSSRHHPGMCLRPYPPPSRLNSATAYRAREAPFCCRSYIQD